ncbi:MAG: hypothetical protein MK086_08170 [Flavobacteriales bacterium]|nr:hypothetical protein [Flavobacteriales bacterium]
MKKILLLLFAATSFLVSAQLPTFDYAFSFRGDSREEKIMHSPNGNYLVVGNTTAHWIWILQKASSAKLP